jgi:DNA replicative helicase MCM subunit Mcm2 (Cdc46/Mcm family)
MDESLLRRICAVLQESAAPEIVACSGLTPDGPQSRSLCIVEVDFAKLLDWCPELYGPLLENPLLLLETLRSATLTILQSLEDPEMQKAATCTVSVRPVCVPHILCSAPSLATHRSALCVIVGTVVRMTSTKVVPFNVRLKCPACNTVVEEPSDPHNRGARLYRRCSGKKCRGQELQQITATWMDYAECRIQLRSDVSGRLPRSTLVALDDELGTRISVGQVVQVVAIAKPRWSGMFAEKIPQIELVLWALNVTPVAVESVAASKGTKVAVEEVVSRYKGDPHAMRTMLVNSVCPHIAGWFAPRLGVLLASVGGSPKASPHAASAASKEIALQLRSTIHMLLVGDPSTGKSQLLRCAAAIATRSTSTTGMMSTSAGLTVAAAKEHGEWVLEPGALVLSDGGTCIIDEIRTVKAADRNALHEAMEQQTISVAKAGLVTKLRTACSVVAACNPYGGTMRATNAPVEIGVGGPLLSRFDLIFLMWDKAGEDSDMRIASHILDCSAAPPSPPLRQDEVAVYLAHVRRHYSFVGGPLLTDAAAQLIGKYYHARRRSGPAAALSDAVPITVRFLEGLVRLAQAHARLLLKSECNDDDAAVAIFLMEKSAHSLKLPLRGAIGVSAGGPLYTSSPLLDAVFLSDDSEGQAEVLSVLKRHVEGLASEVDVWEAHSEATCVLTASSAGSPLTGKRPRED